MIVITGAAGFIGSCLLRFLNEEDYEDILLVDDFNNLRKNRNLDGKAFKGHMDRREFPAWFEAHAADVEFVLHMGARTDTTEADTRIFDELNLNYSRHIWNVCSREGIPLIYASSAATYGDGSHGYLDDHTLVAELHPLNPYGMSKNDFDKWALAQPEKPPYWAGLKFFNVYGPNEYHKGKMASVIYHAYNQILETGMVKLFRSHRDDYEDGEQLRDFIYVKDVVEIIHFMMVVRSHPGLYNIGTGKARTFYDLASSTFQAMEREENIVFIDTPKEIRESYQYFTEAKVHKLRALGYVKNMYSLEDGIRDYVTNYLMHHEYY